MIREDDNGYWEIEDNPISCAGVYPYLGAHLPGAPDPTKVYMVLRPPEELGKPETIESFKLRPWTIGHEMLGAEENGLTPPEEKGVHGVIGEKVYFDEKADPPTLFGNLKGFSEALKQVIKGGIKQLSAGYFHDVEWKGGVWNGKRYDAVQRNISGNHLASVPSGRMGPGVAVMDSLRGFDPNPFELKMSTLLEEGIMDPQKLMEMIQSLIERVKALEDSRASAAGTDKAGAEAAGKDNAGAEAAGKDNAGAGTAGKDNAGAGTAGKDNAGAEAAGKDEDNGNADFSLETLAEALKAVTDRLDRLEGGNAASGDKAGAEGKDQEGAGNEAEKEKNAGASMDAAVLQKQILRDIAGRESLARQIMLHVGTFDHSLMTEKEVAAYGCNKLGVPYLRGQENVAIRAYLKGASAASGQAFSMDSAFSAPASGGKSDKMENYLKEDK